MVDCPRYSSKEFGSNDIARSSGDSCKFKSSIGDNIFIKYSLKEIVIND
jgi:hypothetical protein